MRLLEMAVLERIFTVFSICYGKSTVGKSGGGALA
jgi:hypothetical protein